jgi:hypothetical protein
MICRNNGRRKHRFHLGGSGDQLLNLRWPDGEENMINE